MNNNGHAHRANQNGQAQNNQGINDFFVQTYLVFIFMLMKT